MFQYKDDGGSFCSISSTDVNNYLQENTGDNFTAKVFRTWGATVAAAEFLAPLGSPESENEIKKNSVAAVKYAAEVLGNTPAVCRQYYLHPAVIISYESGRLDSLFQDIKAGKIKAVQGLSDIEVAVLHLLKSHR
ncbi:MAG: hypothetical protein GWN00_34550 [Aliifodinibius sp.]|nr:hypothetical protein [Fodinibius sp.]NIV15823.1 hypothetical protein [Fodinibius sp.]NIY29724.1 hypothetical protein [Fodinibius sp.]